MKQNKSSSSNSSTAPPTASSTKDSQITPASRSTKVTSPKPANSTRSKLPVEVLAPQIQGKRTTTGTSRAKRLPLAGQQIHFVGIGGCGMSGLARMARAGGAIVTGSDQADSETIEQLQGIGIEVALEQTADAVPIHAQLLVISAAIKPDHPEVVEAKGRGVKVIKYAQMLGQVMATHTGIAVAGTHGKSTTTSMLSHILIQCQLDPSFIIGANCKQIGGGFRSGQNDLLIAEACEYDRSFHNLKPKMGVILNVEADHLDMYSGIEEIVESFAEFAKLIPSKKENGSLLIQHEVADRLKITGGLNCAIETIGFTRDADWQIEVRSDSTHETHEINENHKTNVTNKHGGALPRPTVHLIHKNECVAKWLAPLPGDHMAYNSAVAAVTAHRCGCDWQDIARATASFEGLDRRMQKVGEKLFDQPSQTESNLAKSLTATIVDDYGHHPTEVDASLRALRNHYQPKRLICVFQPHQHSRTRFLLDEFAASFDKADVIIVPHIYFVRDSKAEQHAVRASDLVDRLIKRDKRALHLYPFEAIVDHLQHITQPGDLVVTMGAGDVWRIGKEFLRS